MRKKISRCGKKMTTDKFAAVWHFAMARSFTHGHPLLSFVQSIRRISRQSSTQQLMKNILKEDKFWVK
jgi:hypothetical protein